jgi:energy-coupling factor transporter ATP-binding protein EcfA2
MTENFIKRIFVTQSRNVTNLDIPLSETSRQHLILTGKNGSGKTSLLLEINKYLSKIENGNFQYFEESKNQLEYYKNQISLPTSTEDERLNFGSVIKDLEKSINSFGGTLPEFSGSKKSIFEKSQNGSFILSFFDSKRHTQLNVPKGINKIEIKKKYNLGEKANVNFIQYIVNLKADRSFARDDNETDTIEKIDAWFSRFENRLKSIFNEENLELRFDT